MQTLYSLNTPRNVTAGIGSIQELTQIKQNHNASSVTVITDQGVTKAGIADKVLDILKTTGATIYVESSIPPEPEINDVLKLYNELKSQQTDLIVAVGGGSVMDSAKLVSVMLKNGIFAKNIRDAKLIESRGVPTVMIPTTAGTGSESTPNSIVLIPEENLKVGIVSTYFLPDHVILDPVMTQNLPPHITASTGIDALCHAIECFISKRSNNLSDLFALKAVDLIFKYLERAYFNGCDLIARENMQLAAFYGGVAISSSSTVAVHALSYPLGGKFRIPHGVANAMLLPGVMKANISSMEAKIRPLAAVMGIDPTQCVEEINIQFIKKINDLNTVLQIPTDLKKYNVTSEDLDYLADNALTVKRLLDNNPKELTRYDIKAIYKQLL